MKKKITNENKTVANYILDVFMGIPTVWTYADENNQGNIDILFCRDKPIDCVTSYATIGLSDYSIGLKVGEIPLGVEIVGACASEYEIFPNIISTCAFNIINSHFECRPGTIYQSVVSMYFPSTDMKHIVFVPPFGWEKEFTTLNFSTKKVAWLLAVPISDKEYQYAEENGKDALLTILEDKQIDIYNLNRASVL